MMTNELSAQEYQVAYFDHQKHGIQQKEISLCRDGLDNDSDGKKDQLDEGCKSNQQSLSCQKCHVQAQGKKYQFNKMNHDSCMPCHSVIEIMAVAKTPSIPYCRSCHINGNTFRFPPLKQNIRRTRFINDQSFFPEGGWSKIGITSSFDHEYHAKIGGVCKQCHLENKRTNALKKPTEAWRGNQFEGEFILNGHNGCFKCHTSVNPKINDCTGCHDFSSPKQNLEINPNRTIHQFNHNGHRDSLGQLPCQKCHTQLKHNHDALIPLPKMADCASCHSGKIAFDMSEQNCKNCHSNQP